MQHAPHSAAREQMRLAQVNYAQTDDYQVVGDTNRQGLSLVAPGGVHYIPTEDDFVLLVTAEGTQLCAGVLQAPAGHALLPGELSLRSAGGATIVLKNNGEIHLNGRIVESDGTLK